MPRGGKRPGAGRPKGSGTPKKKTNKTNEIAQQAAGEGVLPLQVMLEAMRAEYAVGRLQDAAKIAAIAAPYIHPRLANLAHSGAGLAISVSVESNKLAVDVLRKHLESVTGGGMTAIPQYELPRLPASPPRFDGAVETGAVDTGAEASDEER